MLFKRAIIFSLFTFRSVVTAAEFDWDCINFIDTCNNACFAIHCKGAAATLTYDSDKENGGPRRDASGCNARPCMTINYDQYGDSCNEYPFASVKEGGKDVILRCVDMSDNASMSIVLVDNFWLIHDRSRSSIGQLWAKFERWRSISCVC